MAKRLQRSNAQPNANKCEANANLTISYQANFIHLTADSAHYHNSLRNPLTRSPYSPLPTLME